MVNFVILHAFIDLHLHVHVSFKKKIHVHLRLSYSPSAMIFKTLSHFNILLTESEEAFYRSVNIHKYSSKTKLGG